MDNNLLEKTRQAVEKYHSKQAGDKVKATRSILSAVLDCRNFITEESQEGSPQLARELTEVLSVLPMFSNFASDKAALSNIDTKESATEHLQLIQQSLENSLKEMQVGKKKKIQDWVKSHPVLGKLKKTATKDLPAGAYVLLFRRSASLPQKRKNNSKRDRDKRQKSESGLNVQSKIAALTILEQAGEENLDLLNAAQGTSTENENSAELQNAENKSCEHESPKTEDSAGEETCNSELIVTNSNAEDSAATAELDSTDSTGATEQAAAEDDGAESDDSESNDDDDDDDVDLVSEDEQEDVISESENNGAEHSESKSTETASDESPNPTQESDAAGGAQIQNVKPAAEVIPPDLVVRPAPDGKVFTRFRPKEFSDDTRLYRMFRGGPPLVGACIIADGKLVSSIGVLPQAPEGRDQLRLLLTLSKDAVGKPGRDFVESNEVLAELHQVCKSRSLHKDAYILLFQNEQKLEDETSSENLADKQTASAETSGVATPVNEAKELPADSANTETSQEADAESASIEPADSSATDVESSATESVEETGAPASSETSSKSNEPGEVKGQAQESDTQETSAPPKIELVSKTTEDGRIITRYRSFDFSDMRAIHENFRKRPTVIGAAIIRERELIKVLGTVPTSEGTKQLDVLLGASRQALEKPAIEFISSNQVLNSLYELSNGEFRQREYDVVLFAETEGRPEVLAMPDRRGFSQAKTPLAEFRIPKMLHDRFKSEKAVVGASIICEQSAPAPSREVAGKGSKDKNKDRDRGSKPDNSFRTRSAPRSQVVLAAFGKTPLKQNVLLSAEILKRLGVDLSIL